MEHRLPRASFWRDHEHAVQAIAVAAVVTGAVYLGWRAGWTSRGANPVTFTVLLAAEVFGWISLSCYVLMAWRVRASRRPPRNAHPTVDVYVCTYDEPVAVLHATLAGCRAIRYPHTTWLLDDGGRPEMANLAEEMGARYVTRGGNAHAKAGNINHALEVTNAELVLVLDADHVPMPDILDATLGYFEDPDVALVQTPHDFYNRDSVQHSKGSRHEQTLFYSVIAPGKDRWNSMFWCGSATVLRRDAILGIGGVLTDTVAEDFHTTIALHAAGHRTRYHDETLVQGLAPHDLAAFLLQRDRWARGNLRVFRTKQNPVTCRGLTLAQRVSYTGSLLNYFSGVQRIVMLTVLAATLLTGALPLTASPLGLAAVWLPWTALSVLATLALARGTLGPADSTQYGLMTMGIFTRAVLGLIGRRSLAFRVTPKAGIDEGGLHVLRALPLLTAAGTVLLAATVLRALTALGPGILPPLHGFALAVTLAVAAWELGWILRVLGALVRRRQLRARYRFPVDLGGLVGGQVVHVADLSPTGFAVEGPERYEVGDALELSVRLPAADGRVHDVTLPAEVRSVVPLDAERTRVGCRITTLGQDAEDQLVEYCYVVEPLRSLRGENTASRTAAPVSADQPATEYPAAS